MRHETNIGVRERILCPMASLKSDIWVAAALLSNLYFSRSLRKRFSYIGLYGDMGGEVYVVKGLNISPIYGRCHIRVFWIFARRLPRKFVRSSPLDPWGLARFCSKVFYILYDEASWCVCVCMLWGKWPRWQGSTTMQLKGSMVGA